MLKPNFDDTYLQTHGMIFEDGEFVAFADANYAELASLLQAQLEEAEQARAELAKTIKIWRIKNHE